MACLELWTLIDSWIFTYLLCSKQRDPVFNAGKNSWLFSLIALSLPATSQPNKNQYTADAQWFSVSATLVWCQDYCMKTKLFISPSVYSTKNTATIQHLKVSSVHRGPLSSFLWCHALNVNHSFFPSFIPSQLTNWPPSQHPRIQMNFHNFFLTLLFFIFRTSCAFQRFFYFNFFQLKASSRVIFK